MNEGEKRPPVRWGTFRIWRPMLDDQPEMVKQIMGRCIILRAQWRPDTEEVEYMAISDDFDEVPYGSAALEYCWVWNDETKTLLAERNR